MESIPLCPHRPTCPGCPRFGATDVAPNAYGLLGTLASETGADLARPLLGKRSAFRVRARLAVRGRSASPKIGIFQEGSHRIADIPRCPIHHPTINTVGTALRAAIRETKVRPYADAPHVGDLRYVQIVIERGSGRALLTLVGNHETPERLTPLCTSLKKRLGDELLGVWWNGNPARGNTILGPHWEHLWGAREIVEKIGGAPVCFPPWAFGQSNLDLADELVAYVHALTERAQVVAEFHAGVGAIGLGILARGARVRANEISTEALDSMTRAAALQGPEAASRLETMAGTAGAAVAILGGVEGIEMVDVAVLDPPRRGLDAALLQGLIDHPPPQLVYVACGTPALINDIHKLVASGRWK
ncbi:MAG: 23S rRNA (uracil1939-C5)-methyltransferase, partial [Candidatus Binatia bacterium]